MTLPGQLPGSPGAARRERLLTAKLYLVCDSAPGGRELSELLHSAIAGGVDVVQLRDKHLGDEELVAVAHAAHALCERLGALFIVNDRPMVALESGADGIHVGQDDMPVAEVREMVGDELLIGLSTHSESEIDASALGAADYIGVGPVHATPTKLGRPAVGAELVSYASSHSKLPFFAIGGIDLDNIREVLQAGADRIAVLRAITDAKNPQMAAEQLTQALKGTGEGSDGG